MKCYICGEEFVPDPVQVAEWGNSGRDFEPTDWECDDCKKAFMAAFDAMEAEYEERNMSYDEDQA